MNKWKLKDPNARIVLSGGRGEINGGNITDELVEATIASNDRMREHFIEESEEETGEEE